MFVTMVIAALIIDAVFSGAGLIPSTRPTRADVFGHIAVDYKLFTNVLGVGVFAALFWLTVHRGATDPVCGMRVDRTTELRCDDHGRIVYFCSEHCLHEYEQREAHRG